MSNIWNEFDLKRPPLITLPVKDGKFVTRLHSVLRDYFQRNKEQVEEFDFTATLLSRLTLRRKNSFRNMIGFRAIRKINTAVRRLLRVDLQREIKNFQSTLPDLVLSLEGVNEVATRNCLDYVLLRLIAVHEIHIRISNCCVEAADYFSKMLRNNYFFDTNTLLLAVLGKLFALNIVKDNKSIELYRCLLQERSHFPTRLQCQFLPKDFEFPKQLEKIQVIESSKTKELSTNSAMSQRTSSAKRTATAQLISTPKSQIFIQSSKNSHLTEPDLGVAVSRATKKPKFDSSHLQNVKDVQKFIKSENLLRKQKPSDLITKNIKDHEWLAIAKLFENKVRAKQEQKAVNIFKKFVSSKI